MDAREKETHAQQHKAQVDLNERHAKVWGNFQKRRDEHAQKYGSAYADILLRAEKEALETQLNQDNKALSERHDQQWLAYHENPSLPEQPSPVLQETKSTIKLPENDIKSSDGKAAQPSSEQARRTLFSNPFRQTEPEQKQEITSQTKDIDQSQDYMKTMLATHKDNSSKEKKVENDKKPVSISIRFSQGLSYTKAQMKTDKSPAHGKDKDMDRD